jgi:hypothetical protein
MNTVKFRSFALIVRLGLICLFSWTATLVQAATPDFEEVSYDDLVNQLNRKKTSITENANDPLDAMKIHAGFGLITSANSVNVQGKDSFKYQNGFQISLGIDLFSANWAAETALRNFGQAFSGTETRSLREFDLKLMRRDLISSTMGYRMGAGIGTRYLKIDDSAQNLSINDSTPASLFFAGLDAYLSKNMSLGIEAGLRSSMVNQTADKNAADLTVRLDSYF